MKDQGRSREILMDAVQKSGDILPLLIQIISIVHDVALFRERRTLPRVMEMILLDLRQILFEIPPSQQPSIVGFDAGFSLEIGNIIIMVLITQSFLHEHKLPVPFLQLKQIEVVPKINIGINGFRHFSALEKELVRPAVQGNVFGQFLFVHPVEELEERQEIALPRPVRANQQVNWLQLQIQIPKRFISPYLYPFHTLFPVAL